MSVSTLHQSFSAATSKGRFDDMLDNDMSSDLIDVEGIFDSVFSSPFDENDDLISKVSMTNFGLQLNVPKPTQTTVQQAVPVSPTASSNELSSYAFDLRPAHSRPRAGKQNEASLYEPAPLEDIMVALSEQPPTIIPSTGKSPQPRKKRPAPSSKKSNTVSRPTKKQRNKAVSFCSSSSSLSSESTSMGSTAHDDKTSEEIMEQTRLRNREHARKSRMRKKILTKNLQHSFEALKEENEKLRKLVMQAFGPNKTEEMILERTGFQPSVEQFIGALKTPENRVLDGKGLSFLAGLRKDAIAARSA